MALEKQVSYTATNTYSTLNIYSEKTVNVWFIFHGMGYLSRYFINYFSHLNPEENFIIAPQAPSKYYQGKDFKHVGASWLTRENTVLETKNILEYVDRVFETEAPKPLPRFIVLGYSQGVSIALRWLALKKINCNEIVLHSGGIPKELVEEDFRFLNDTAKVTYIYGNQDAFITEAKKTEENLKGSALFGNRLNIKVFDGKHEVDKAFISELAKSGNKN